MTFFVMIFMIGWIIRIGANILSYIQLWFIKEYRFDRVWIHLKSPQGKRILFPAFRKPPISPKTLLLSVYSLVVLGGLFLMLPGAAFTKLLLIDLFTFPIISFGVLVLKFPTHVYHRYTIGRAIQKLRNHKKMIVIGITGSYGKTSTKEILFSILGEKYKTLATAGSKNSPIAIAELVLSQLEPDTDVFIVEMGAYKQGEIAQMCRMVHPEIGIITAINPQHQDLFGSIENTMNAKFELLEGLVGKRVAVINADDHRVKQMGNRATSIGCTVREYSTKGLHVVQQIDGISWGKYKVPLFGVHQVANVLAAMAAAKELGMNEQEIKNSLHHVVVLPHTMRPLKGTRGATFIDDTFNNNPDAAIAAIDFLKTAKGKKFLVFQPMIELGAFAQESHERVAAYASQVCDEVFLTNDSFADVFAGAHVLSPQDAAKRIGQTVKQGDMVVFKGKEASRVLQLLV